MIPNKVQKVDVAIIGAGMTIPGDFSIRGAMNAKLQSRVVWVGGGQNISAPTPCRQPGHY